MQHPSESQVSNGPPVLPMTTVSGTFSRQRVLRTPLLSPRRRVMRAPGRRDGALGSKGLAHGNPKPGS